MGLDLRPKIAKMRLMRELQASPDFWLRKTMSLNFIRPKHNFFSAISVNPAKLAPVFSSHFSYVFCDFKYLNVVDRVMTIGINSIDAWRSARPVYFLYKVSVFFTKIVKLVLGYFEPCSMLFVRLTPHKLDATIHGSLLNSAPGGCFEKFTGSVCSGFVHGNLLVDSPCFVKGGN